MRDYRSDQSTRGACVGPCWSRLVGLGPRVIWRPTHGTRHAGELISPWGISMSSDSSDIPGSVSSQSWGTRSVVPVVRITPPHLSGDLVKKAWRRKAVAMAPDHSPNAASPGHARHRVSTRFPSPRRCPRDPTVQVFSKSRLPSRAPSGATCITAYNIPWTLPGRDRRR